MSYIIDKYRLTFFLAILFVMFCGCSKKVVPIRARHQHKLHWQLHPSMLIPDRLIPL